LGGGHLFLERAAAHLGPSARRPIWGCCQPRGDGDACGWQAARARRAAEAVASVAGRLLLPGSGDVGRAAAVRRDEVLRDGGGHGWGRGRRLCAARSRTAVGRPGLAATKPPARIEPLRPTPAPPALVSPLWACPSHPRSCSTRGTNWTGRGRGEGGRGVRLVLHGSKLLACERTALAPALARGPATLAAPSPHPQRHCALTPSSSPAAAAGCRRAAARARAARGSRARAAHSRRRGRSAAGSCGGTSSSAPA
jgi:hypothetical protein